MPVEEGQGFMRLAQPRYLPVSTRRAQLFYFSLYLGQAVKHMDSQFKLTLIASYKLFIILDPENFTSLAVDW